MDASEMELYARWKNEKRKKSFLFFLCEIKMIETYKQREDSRNPHKRHTFYQLRLFTH